MLITRRVVLPVLLLVGGLLIGSNVVLQTGTVRGWFERKLERNSGLDWTIAYLSWTPWTGIQVGQVKAELREGRKQGAEPVYEAEEIDVQVYWARLLEGRLALREVRLREGRVAIPIELMALLPRGEEREAAGRRAEQEFAVNPPAAGDPATEEEKPKPRGKRPGKTEQGKKRRGGQAREKAKPPEETATPVVRRPAGPPVKIVIEGCEVSLYSITGQGRRRLALEGVEAELPVAGEDAEGWLASTGVTMGGEFLSGPFRAKLYWQRPYLLMPMTRFEWNGLTLQASGSVRAGGTPLCAAEVRVLPGPLGPTPVLGWSGLEVAAERVEMLGRFTGSVRDVRTWKGDAVMEANEVLVAQKDRGKEFPFELARVTTTMRGGALQVSDARVLSERLSFLGNGVVLPNGRVLGVMRVVADREHAEAITRVAVGSFIAGGWTQSWLDPLITPDRHYRDINVRGTMGKATVDVGKKGEELEVNRAWERMVAFVKDEVDESRSGVTPSTPRERMRAPQ